MPPPPPSPVQISHKKDGHQRRPHRFHVSCPSPLPPHPAARSDAAGCIVLNLNGLPSLGLPTKSIKPRVSLAATPHHDRLC